MAVGLGLVGTGLLANWILLEVVARWPVSLDAWFWVAMPFYLVAFVGIIMTAVYGLRLVTRQP